MFAGHDIYDEPLWTNLTQIYGLELINTSQALRMDFMFAYSKISELPGIEYWDVSGVQDFSAMF
jgi:hypothetical protein